MAYSLQVCVRGMSAECKSCDKDFHGEDPKTFVVWPFVDGPSRSTFCPLHVCRLLAPREQNIKPKSGEENSALLCSSKSI